MKIESKIALRYIFSKRSFNFITVITTISILGIAVGTASLIAVMSIFNGFQEITVKQIVGFDPHIRINSSKGNMFSPDDGNLINSMPKNAISIAPIIDGKAVGMKSEALQVFNLFGIPDKYDVFSDEISKSIVVGRFDFDYGDFGKGIVVGTALADRLGIFPGDIIEIMSPVMLESSISTFSPPKGERLYVAGIFQTNIKDYDLSTAFVSDITARKIFRIPEGKITTIDIRFASYENSDKTARAMQKSLGDDFVVSSWIHLNRDLYEVMQLEKLASFSIIGIIILIAVFNVLSSLAMTVTEKKRDIGLLKSLGATNRSIRNIYLIEGSLIGLIGTSIGVVLGLIFTFGQIHYKWFKIDTSKYIIDAIPISLNFIDIFWIALFAMSLSFLATLYPAKKAADTIVIDALRGE